MKKVLVAVVLISVMLLSSCVPVPYYHGGAYSYSAVPQYSYWGFYNEPVRFYGYPPTHSVIYDPLGLWPSLVQGLGAGLGFGFIHGVFGRHHHH